MDVGEKSWLEALKRYFGFTSFRPLQREIIGAALAGKDVFALLPTGGGKSLCFQLPALLRPGLTVVVSPLIALMKDQVDALQAAGVAATFLNSSLAAGESRQRLRGLHQGAYRLLYAAPERLMLSGFLADLQRWNVNLVAVDEAHCISEWGHDFRPEYRQLSALRGLFPKVPLMALTATATTRVRDDIVKLLQLREPGCFVASFNRPNLDLSRRGQGQAVGAGAGIPARAPARQRHHLLPQPQRRRGAGRPPRRARHSCQALPRRPVGGGAEREPGTCSCATKPA